MQKKRISVKEVELRVMGSATAENQDALLAGMESYRRMVFPGSEKTSSSEQVQMEQRKAALAREAGKAFIVRPIDVKELMKRGADPSANPEVAKLAGRAMVEEERKRFKAIERQHRAKLKKKAMDFRRAEAEKKGRK
tara:strand:- start:3 stop:413 length:411 start_codon:yes stop_codon:yes gene_type:complete